MVRRLPIHAPLTNTHTCTLTFTFNPFAHGFGVRKGNLNLYIINFRNAMYVHAVLHAQKSVFKHITASQHRCIGQ